MPAKSNSKPVVLIVENSTAVTGAFESVLRSSVRLTDSFDFLFLVPSGSAVIGRVEKYGFFVCELPMLELRKTFSSLIFYIPTLLINSIRFSRLVSKLNATLIHSNDYYNLIPAVYRFFGGRTPYVCHMRFMPSRFPPLLLKSFMFMHEKFATITIAVSPAVSNALKSKRLVVIADSLPLEDSVLPTSNSNVILYPGSFTRGKGQNYAIEAFARTSTSNPAWVLRFIGGDFGLKKNQAYKKELMERARVLGILEKIQWGEISSDMSSEYANSSIVLNFSDSESFSLVCQEALFYGRPIISTDSGGPSFIIDNNETGIMVPCGDVNAMALALEELITNRRRRTEIATMGMARVRQRFGVEKTVTVLHDVYTNALKQ